MNITDSGMSNRMTNTVLTWNITTPNSAYDPCPSEDVKPAQADWERQARE